MVSMIITICLHNILNVIFDKSFSLVYDIEGNKKVQIYDYRFPKDMF